MGPEVPASDGDAVTGLSFARDIRPLFRPGDIRAMLFAFDLSSYEDVRENAGAILETVSEGSMPCDLSWSETEVERLRQWIDAGTPR